MMFPYESMMPGINLGGVSGMMSPWMAITFGVLMIWDVIWKGIGLWKACRNKQLGWFIAILVVNSLGILPIVYVMWFQKKNEEKTTIILKEEPVNKKLAKKKK